MASAASAAASAAIGAGAAAAQPHDCVRAVAQYVNKMLKPKEAGKLVGGMKCLLLDKETKTILSMVYSMHEILSKDVYLVEMVDAPSASVAAHIKAMVLVRPSMDNVRALMTHLASPRYGEYHIFFTNPLPQEALRKLAEADVHAVVKQVQEFYADYYAINSDLFSVQLPASLTLSRPRGAYSAHEDAGLKRAQQGLLATLLSFKVKPYVRYQESSEAAGSLARDIAGIMGGERELFTFSKQASGGVPLLLIIDRREDPVTPLLMSWTYQAMVHELIKDGIKNNTVNLKYTGVAADMEEVVLAATQDSFFRDHMYDNYGDLGDAVARIFADYSAARGSHDSISSIEDMQRFVEKYPELKTKGLLVSKHVAIMSEMNKVLHARGLMELSEIEQNVSSTDGASEQLRAIQETLSNPSVDPFDALRLIMLFSLRYERSKPAAVSELRRWASSELSLGGNLGLVDTLLSYAGAAVRKGDLFGTGGSLLTRVTSSVTRSVKGVENVFTQHTPYLMTLLDQLARGRLRKDGPGAYPFVGPEPPPGKFSTVIVFMLGGVTYEEAARVHEWNSGRFTGGAGGAASGSSAAGGSSSAGVAPFRVVLGGTTIHSSKTFIAELQHLNEAPSASSASSSDTGAGLGAL